MVEVINLGTGTAKSTGLLLGLGAIGVGYFLLKGKQESGGFFLGGGGSSSNKNAPRDNSSKKEIKIILDKGLPTENPSKRVSDIPKNQLTAQLENKGLDKKTAKAISGATNQDVINIRNSLIEGRRRQIITQNLRDYQLGKISSFNPNLSVGNILEGNTGRVEITKKENKKVISPPSTFSVIKRVVFPSSPFGAIGDIFSSIF